MCDINPAVGTVDITPKYNTTWQFRMQAFQENFSPSKVITIIGSRTSVSYCLNFLKKGERQNEDFGTQVRGF